MDFAVRQKELDMIKWYDSIVAGEDRCGSYSYCNVCCKEEPYPCAQAEERSNRKTYIRIATFVRRRSK